MKPYCIPTHCPFCQSELICSILYGKGHTLYCAECQDTNNPLAQGHDTKLYPIPYSRLKIKFTNSGPLKKRGGLQSIQVSTPKYWFCFWPLKDYTAYGLANHAGDIISKGIWFDLSSVRQIESRIALMLAFR